MQQIKHDEGSGRLGGYEKRVTYLRNTIKEKKAL
jgi:hypothetical protein